MATEPYVREELVGTRHEFVASVRLRNGRVYEARSPEKPIEALERLVDLLAEALEDRDGD